MRHSINPAFQPVQEFYMAFPIIGYTSLWAGNYDLTLSDWIYKDPSGKTITALHPDGKEHWITLPNMLTLNEDATINLFSLGWQVRERGFFHINSHGGAEPCPFSPFSDINVKDTSLKEALNSGLFQALHNEQFLLDDHIGGCVLYEKREAVEALLANSRQ